MYIITKTKDYYDGVVGTVGIDKTLVYQREPVRVEDPQAWPKPFRPNKGYDSKASKNHFRTLDDYTSKKGSLYSHNQPFIVGFCGKLYIGWKFYRMVDKSQPWEFREELETLITYDLDFVRENVRPTTWSGNLEDDISYIQSFDAMGIFRELKMPIFIYDSDYNRRLLEDRHYKAQPVFITNPILKDYSFFKVMDSFTTFQEIQMFIGGVLGQNEKDIVEVDDKYKITQHGFDKFSFRKDKENGNKR